MVMTTRVTDDINAALQALVGLRLCLTRRSADLRQFHFGQLRKDGPKRWGAWALHLTCPWRLDGPAGLVAGSGDLRYRADGAAVNAEQRALWNYDTDGNLQDELFGRFFAAVPGKGGQIELDDSRFVVERASADAGVLTITLSGGVCLTAFPDGTRDEAWRFFSPDSDERHLVIVGDRLDES